VGQAQLEQQLLEQVQLVDQVLLVDQVRLEFDLLEKVMNYLH